MSKQSAVEWLVKQLLANGDIRWRGTAIHDLAEQAKAMEKEQMERMYSEEEVEVIAKDAYAMGRNNILIGVFNKWFEQFKKKGGDK
jgi:hypothetical protein